MKAILLPGDGEIKLVNLPDPQPGPGEVVLAMRCSGVCGTDLHFLRESVEQRGDRAGVVPGHEASGVIVAVGEGVVHRKVGERVIGYHHIGCGFCQYCRAGAPTMCANKRVVGRHIHGSDGQYEVLPEWAVLPLPDDFSFEEGALLACNVSTAYSALRKGAVSPGTRLVIFGQGGVGLSAVLLARALGARIAAVDLSDNRMRMGAAFGVEKTINPARENVVEEIRQWSGGRGADVVLECSGSSKAMQQAVQAAGPQTAVVFVGGGGVLETPVAELLAKELKLYGSSVYKPHEFDDMLRLIREKQVPIAKLIARSFLIEEASAAFALAAKQEVGKVLFRWE